MFENQNPPAAAAGVTPTPPTGGPVPPNVAPQSAAPVGRPAAPSDMFADVEPAASADRPAGAAGQMSRPMPPRPAVFQPKPASPVASADRPATGSSPYNFEEAAPKTNLKKLMVLGGLVVAMVLIVGGGYWGYKKYSGVSAGNTDNLPAPEVKTDNNQAANVQPTGTQAQPEVKTETPSAVAGESGNVASGTAVAAAAKDSDDDGLSDAEEASLGTNPNAVDSDNDGLFDREEVKVYGTDPLKADTDGDGYSDGVEVKGGFNPLGWGKLFDPTNPNANK